MILGVPRVARSIRGSVVCDSRHHAAEGVPGVLVSDGEAVAATDESGRFAFAATNACDPIFICSPAGYRPVGDFYQHVDGEDSLVFRLAPAVERATSRHTFALLADYQWEPNDTMRAVFSRLLSDPAGPQFIVHVGDLFYMMEGAPVPLARRYYQAYRDILSEFSVPVYNPIGNHDLLNGPPFRPKCPSLRLVCTDRCPGPTYYSFDWGEIHYIVLDPFQILGKTQHSRLSERQLRWLQQDLAADGSYTLQTGRESGLPAGQYKVTVVSLEQQDWAGPGPPPPGRPIVPLWYQDPNYSGLELTVDQGGKQIDLELKRERP